MKFMPDDISRAVGRTRWSGKGFDMGPALFAFVMNLYGLERVCECSSGRPTV